MNNIKFFHGISKFFYVISNIATVLLFIALVFTVAVSVFLIALPNDTVVLGAQGDVNATIKVSNIVSDPFGFLENEKNDSGFDKGEDGEVQWEVKDGTMTGKATGYGEGVASFEMNKDGVLKGDALSENYTINNYQIGIVTLPKVIQLMFLLVAIYYGKRIFRELKGCETPFTETVRKNLVKLSAVILGFSFIPAFIEKVFLVCMSLSDIEKSGI
ncbi:MAG: hypothetical protein ACI4HM_05500, partial [Ruminococcus sp.]